MNARSASVEKEHRSPRVGSRSGAPRRTRRPGSVLDGYFDRAGLVGLLDADDEVRLAQAMEAGRDAGERLAGHAPATPEERAELEGLVAAGEQARERFIAANLRLVLHIAWRHPAATGVELADLIQDGNVGLIEAVDRFD